MVNVEVDEMTNIERVLGNHDAKLEDIHKWVKNIDRVLSGNGQKGLVQEFNQYKGGLKVLCWFTGIAVPLIGGLIIFILNQIHKLQG